jgi:hypothetical protein
MKNLISVIMLALIGLATDIIRAQDTNHLDQYRALGVRGRQIADQLQTFDRSADYFTLWETAGILHSVTFTNKEMERAGLVLNLEVLNRGLQGIDPNWDDNKAKRPVTKVAPELPDGTRLRPGVNPSAITDPEARKRYEDAVAENEKLRKAFNQQIFSRKVVHGSLYAATTRLQRLVNARDTQALTRATNSILAIIKDQKTQMQLFEVIKKATEQAELWRTNGVTPR